MEKANAIRGLARPRADAPGHPSPTLPPGAKPAAPAATSRLILLHQRLAAGQPVTAAALASGLEMSPRTMKRDIERLRDTHHAPIAWDATLKTYRYTAPFDLLTGLRLDADETIALVLAAGTFAAWGDSPLGRSLTAALTKIARFAGQAVSLPASELRAVLHQPETDDRENRHFARLLDDIVAHREITLTYQKPEAPRPERRTVRPLHLAHLEHRWMLVAEDPSRAGWRNFLLSRIEAIAPTGNVFAPPPPARLRAYLAGSLGRFTGTADHTVRLRFTATAARYVRERPWHASQTISDLPDGVIEVTLRLNNLIDVQRRILANGHHIAVLAPPELRASIATEIALLTRTYAPEIASL